MQNPATVMDDEPVEPSRPTLAGVPDRPPTGLQRAETLCQLRRFSEAVPAVAAVITAAPRDATAWCLMAEAQLGNDRPAAALQAAHAAASLAPGSERPRRLASLSLGRLGRTEEAIEAAVEGTRCEPDSWRAHAQLAESLAVLRHRRGDARRAVEMALALGPDEAGPHLTAGTVALAGGRRGEAASAFCAALAVDPQCLEAHHQLAGVHALGPRGRRASIVGRAAARILRRGNGES